MLLITPPLSDDGQPNRLPEESARRSASTGSERVNIKALSLTSP